MDFSEASRKWCKEIAQNSTYSKKCNTLQHSVLVFKLLTFHFRININTWNIDKVIFIFLFIVHHHMCKIMLRIHLRLVLPISVEHKYCEKWIMDASDCWSGTYCLNWTEKTLWMYKTRFSYWSLPFDSGFKEKTKMKTREVTMMDMQTKVV